MLKLLLDEHICPKVASGVQRRNRSLVIHSMVEWESGNFLGKEDSVCLLEAARQRLTLVTYDRRTIPPLLKLWAEEERSHGGVIFVDEKTISPADIGGLVRALTSLADETGEMDWTNQVLHTDGYALATNTPPRSRSQFVLCDRVTHQRPLRKK